MRYLLDTNICIRYLNRRSQAVIRRMEAESPDDIVVCSITRAELMFGAMKSNQPQRTLARQCAFFEPLPTLPFDDAAAVHYGRIRAALEIAGTPIGPNDLLIASIALANNLIVVTNNLREFSRISELKLENWETD